MIKSKPKKQPSLWVCIAMDVVGYASYTMPFIGEFTDLIWAPVSGIVFYTLFGGWKGAAGGVFSFAEELLPGFDFIPTFTIMWIAKIVPRRRPFEPIQPV